MQRVFVLVIYKLKRVIKIVTSVVVNSPIIITVSEGLNPIT